jgi:hypothetical protein
MPELGTSGSVRGRDGQPPGLLDLRYYRKAYFIQGTGLMYGQQFAPCLVPRLKAPHAGRSGGASTMSTRSPGGDSCMARTPSSPHT